MTDDPKGLIHAYLDGRLTAEETEALGAWIKADPSHARLFASYALLHDRLHNRYRSRAALQALGAVRSTPSRFWGRRGLAAAILGLGLALLGVWAFRGGDGPTVAVLVEARAVVWGKGQAPITVGDRLSPRSIRCDSGAFKIRFDAGAMVALEGPADLRILSGMRIHALRGRITARVDGPAKGFAIETPTTLVVDQGTEFGVEIDESGRTDVVVFQGLVDLARTEPAAQPAPIKRLSQGEGLRVGSGGDLSRIVAVERRAGADGWAIGPSSAQGAVIRSVRDNIRGLESAKYYQVVPGGLADDAPAYVDRAHQWNGLDRTGLPAFLRGADYIMTFNEDKWRKDLRITVESAGAATLFVFYDIRLATPGWLAEGFRDLNVRVGLDEGPWPGGPPQEVGRGPGASIDTVFAVWSRDLSPDETIVLGNTEAARPGAVGNAMYGIAAVHRP